MRIELIIDPEDDRARRCVGYIMGNKELTNIYKSYTPLEASKSIASELVPHIEQILTALREKLNDSTEVLGK